jgi:hypothetical protein
LPNKKPNAISDNVTPSGSFDVNYPNLSSVTIALDAAKSGKTKSKNKHSQNKRGRHQSRQSQNENSSYASKSKHNNESKVKDP